MEEKEYIFSVTAGEEKFKIKISIDQYEIIDKNREGYILDVKNGKFLKIDHAKIDLYGNKIDVDSYLQPEEEWSYLDIGQVYDGIIENYEIRSSQRTRYREAVYLKTIFECSEGIVEGYLMY